MAHELTFDAATGKANVFSVRETPWHREGHVLTDAPDLDSAMILAGHRFTVETQPLYIERRTPDGDTYYRTVTDQYATVRTDTGDVLGVVGKRYQPLQNADAFGVLEPLLDAGLATLETGGTLRGGSDVWMQVRFNIDDPRVNEVFADEVVPFGAITNNHSGRRKVVLIETPVRIVCANTLRAALVSSRGSVTTGRAIAVPHTRTVEAKTVEAAQTLWHALIERYAAVASAYDRLKAFHLDTALFRKLVLDVAAPLPEKKAETKRQETAHAKIEARRTDLTRLWTAGAGHTGDGSAWEAYNGLVESLDHNADLWRVKGESRVASMIDGQLADIKDRALVGLLKAAVEVK